MGRSRLQFHQKLLDSLFPEETPEEDKHVYFQEPSNLGMQYPCVIYKVYNIDIAFANNGPYKDTTRYQATVIDENIDSALEQAMRMFPMVSFVRFFVKDQLNHYVFNVYF